MRERASLRASRVQADFSECIIIIIIIIIMVVVIVIDIVGIRGLSDDR